MDWWVWLLIAVGVLLLGLALFDVLQRKHTILRNFPVVGHLRYLLEWIGPELRQYIVTSNNEERPFSRDQRRWIYSAAKQENPYYGFGTDNDLEGSPNYLIIKQSSFPLAEPRPADDFGSDPMYPLPCAKVLGGARGRPHAFRMESAVNISSMSFGSLSGRAVESLNKGAKHAGCLHGTGEGGITRHHRHGGDLVWQIGTAYFGCRDAEGRFDLARFADVVAATPTVRAVEIKVSQGAKPGLGGLLPAAKITREISEVRGIPMGVDCVSPASHSAFHDADSLLDFAERLAQTCGLPIGVKSAVGDLTLFQDLARLMATGERGIDFLTIDGGEGGTGAGPLPFVDHVSLPFNVAFSRVYRTFAEHGVTDKLVFLGAGRLGLPHRALLAFAMGCDGVNVAREAMLSIGCIQAQRCHTDHCPTGVTTHKAWRQRGLDPTLKSVRCANYIVRMRKELLELSRACGVDHPSLVRPDMIEIIDERFGSRTVSEIFGYDRSWGVPAVAETEVFPDPTPGIPATAPAPVRIDPPASERAR
jgi:glutamate synthase domain-containing protein 2